MDHATDEPEASRLQKVVEGIAITPEAAATLVGGYRATFEAKFKREPESLEDKRRVANKIVGRYSKLSAAAGAVTAVPSVIPGVGTAVAVLGGGVTDIAAALKLPPKKHGASRTSPAPSGRIGRRHPVGDAPTR